MTIPRSPNHFRVVGYVTDAGVPETLQFDKLTHINYAFLLPSADGNLQALNSPWKLQRLVELAHEHGVKVLISVGGWGLDAEFEALASRSESRTVFVNGLVGIVDQYQLDGVDIDWEYPDAGQSASNFLDLMREIRKALPAGKLLTAAVVALGSHGSGILSSSFEIMDFVNIMAYDGEGANHSSMEYARQALHYWITERGLPKEKAVLGVPFYARPNGTPYNKIIQKDPQAANIDSFDYYGIQLNYNGIPTIQEKTRLALQAASGIMIWSLEQDTTDLYSLLNAIHQTITSAEEVH